MSATAPDALSWEAEIALLTNRHVLVGLTKALLGGAALVTALVSLLLAVQGDWHLVPRIGGLLLAVGTGLLLVGLLVMRVVFGNRLRMRFTVDADGVTFETVDRAAMAGHRAALLLGLAMGRPEAAGSGLLATLQESQRLQWRGAFRAVGEAATHSIAFRNGWRTLMRIYCRPEQYQAVLTRVEQLMAERGTPGRLPRHAWPVARYLIRTLWVVLACLPVLFASDLFGLTLLLPFLLMCFAIAMVWLVRGMAWVTLGLCAAVLAASFVGAVAPRTSLHRGSTYPRYETLSGDSWALIAFGILGMASLIWLATSILRGRVRPALQADEEDAGLT